MSDGVTGSAAQAFLDHLTKPNDDYMPAAEAIAAIQREAVDAFIRDELPGLLAEALKVVDDEYVLPSLHGEEVAAKIAKLRDANL